MPLLAEISPDAQWLLDALQADARGPAPAWAGISAFHHLRTRPAEEHPAFGTSLLQWQRLRARYGGRAPEVAAEAFLAMPRTERAWGVPARVLELWARHSPLPIEVAGRIVALDVLPTLEAALVAEELALGAHEGARPSPGVLQLVSTRQGTGFAEARALALLERFVRGDVEGEVLASALCPGLLDESSPHLPEVTARLLGGLTHPHAYVPELTPALDAVLAQVRLAACECPAKHPAAQLAHRAVACARALAVDDVLALAQPGRAAEPNAGVKLPLAADVAKALQKADESLAIRVALAFPALSGAAEKGRKLAGLTAWRAARDPDVALSQAHAARAKLDAGSRQRWDALAGGARPTEAAPQPGWADRLLESLRSGSELALEDLLKSELDLSGVLFESPSGPGLLTPEGKLRNGVRAWPAPKQVRLAHPVDLFDAERTAWQARLLASGAHALVNQPFRETHKAGGREPGRKRLERLRGVPLAPAALHFLARRGWFPTLSPVEIPVELVLGEWNARLLAEPGPTGPVNAGVEFWHAGKSVLLGEVPPRVFSEAWRDVDEALALSMPDRSYVPSPARADLLRLLGPRLGAPDLRVESDHVAFTAHGHPERITLHNARPADGELISEGEARALAQWQLPFVDDGGVAAVLVGRVLERLQPDEAEGESEPKEGS
ncbi:MAG: DUF4132 domain-containing protein [Deltaproteobacteria bacterium]|nr:DUF4132 domain-containing protein [Deltaproteobacteria bacterium]